MAKSKFTLRDTHLVILSAAAARRSLNLFPLPTTVQASDKAVDVVITELLNTGLARRAAGVTLDELWRVEDDERIGLVITSKGLKAIGSEVDDELDCANADPANIETAPKLTRASTKQGLALEMLNREGGATLTEIAEATGWLKHSASALLTGLRRKGHEIVRIKRNDKSAYIVGTRGE